MSCSDIFLGLIAVLFPPIAVWVKAGICSADSCLNILLCMLGFIPGLLHAWYIIAKYPEHDYDSIDDPERQGQGRVTYYYISHEPTGRRSQRPQRVQGYGSIPSVPGNKPAPPQNSQQPHYQPPQQPRYQSQQQPQQNGVVRTDDAPSASGASSSSVGAGSGHPDAPPSYSEVIRGDNKVQTQD